MLTESIHDHLETEIQRTLGQSLTPGISIALTDRERTLHVSSHGYAQQESQTALTPAHIIQLGSIGKTFTALALMQLFEEGRFDPEQPAAEYLPWLVIANGGVPVSCHHLLTHTAGIIMGTDEAITAHAEAWALRNLHANPPGTGFHYSNTGYKILGLVLEAIEERPYADIIRTRILEPLGMQDSIAAITNADRFRHAEGYASFPDDEAFPDPFTDKSRLTPVPWIETDTGDGCIASTPADMAIFARAVLGGFAPLIRPDTFAKMCVPDGYGYGLYTMKDGTRLGHGGSMLGHFAGLAVQPDAGLGAAVLMNGPARPERLANRLLDLLTGATATEADRADEADPETDTQREAPPEWTPLTGLYRTHNPWYSHLRVVINRGNLVLLDAFQDPEPLTEVEPGIFRVGGESSPERLHFEMWIDGRPHRAVYSGSAYHRVS